MPDGAAHDHQPQDDQADTDRLGMPVRRARLRFDAVEFHEEQAEAVDGDAERDHRDRGPDPGEDGSFVGEMIADVLGFRLRTFHWALRRAKDRAAIGRAQTTRAELLQALLAHPGRVSAQYGAQKLPLA